MSTPGRILNGTGQSGKDVAAAVGGDAVDVVGRVAAELFLVEAGFEDDISESFSFRTKNAARTGITHDMISFTRQMYLVISSTASRGTDRFGYFRLG